MNELLLIAAILVLQEIRICKLRRRVDDIAKRVVDE